MSHGIGSTTVRPTHLSQADEALRRVRFADSRPPLAGMAVVHLGHHQAPAVGTTIDRVHAGATVSATVTLRSIRPTHSGRAAGVVTALAGGKSTIVTFSADAYRRHARILTPGTRLIVRGQVTDIDRQRVLDVRAAVEVTV